MTQEVTSAIIELRKGYAIDAAAVKGYEKHIVKMLRADSGYTNYYGLYKQGAYLRLGVLGYPAPDGECVVCGYDL